MTFHFLTKYVKTKQKTKIPFSGKKATHCSYLILFLILNGKCPPRALFVKDSKLIETHDEHQVFKSVK